MQKNAITLCGSLRAGSFNEILRRHVSAKLREAGAAVEDIDLSAHPMPLFNEDLEADHTPESARFLARRFAEADIVFITSPEYNSGAAPLIVNTLAWISRQKAGQFRHAAFGLGAVSSGKYGAIVGIYHLRDSLLKVGAMVTPTLLGIGPASTAFDASGAPAEDGVRRKIDSQVAELMHFSRGGI
jgi:NAD(P)H-dependent FMN reductase